MTWEIDDNGVNKVQAEVPLDAPTMHIQHQESSNTDGGTATSGSYQTRTLNTVVHNSISGASLASNQITLPAGKFRVSAKCEIYDCDRSKSILYDVTNTATLLIGMPQFANATNNVGAELEVRGVITLSGETDIELRTQVLTTSSTNGFGRACGFGDTEIFCDVFIEELS